MVEQSLERLLSDDELRARLKRGEHLVFSKTSLRLIERQIERLGFDDLYFVTQVDARRGRLIKVTPVAQPAAIVRHAA
jgi:hypothetical protein